MTDLEHQYFTSVNRHDSLASDCCLCEYGIVGWAGGGMHLQLCLKKYMRMQPLNRLNVDFFTILTKSIEKYLQSMCANYV